MDVNTKAARSLFNRFTNLRLLLVLSCDGSNPSTQTAAHRSAVGVVSQTMQKKVIFPFGSTLEWSPVSSSGASDCAVATREHL